MTRYAMHVVLVLAVVYYSSSGDPAPTRRLRE